MARGRAARSRWSSATSTTSDRLRELPLAFYQPDGLVDGEGNLAHLPPPTDNVVEDVLRGAIRGVAKVDTPDAVQAMLRHLGLSEDPEPDRPARRRDDEPQPEVAYDFGA